MKWAMLQFAAGILILGSLLYGTFKFIKWIFAKVDKRILEAQNNLLNGKETSNESGGDKRGGS